MHRFVALFNMAPRMTSRGKPSALIKNCMTAVMTINGNPSSMGCRKLATAAYSSPFCKENNPMISVKNSCPAKKNDTIRKAATVRHTV